MNNSQNSASQRSIISANLSSRGKLKNPTKLQDPVTVIINAINQSLCTSSTLMVASHQRTRRRTSEGLCWKEALGPSTKDAPNTTSEAELQTVAGGAVEAHI
jgi:hypothetical protein